MLPRVLRATELRKALGLDSSGHVLESRKLRDHLEHFDERLDHWQATSTRRNLLQDLIVPKEKIVGFDEGDMMRWFDPTAKAFRFRGEEYDIQALVTGVEDIQVLASEALQRSGPGGHT
jgi:hypothetical protein